MITLQPKIIRSINNQKVTDIKNWLTSKIAFIETYLTKTNKTNLIGTLKSVFWRIGLNVMHFKHF